MQAFTRIRDLLLQILAVIGGLAILTLMIHVMLDVALRNLSNTPIPATYEIVTNYYMVALAFIPLAWVETGGGMVNVEVIDPLLSPLMRRMSDALVALISCAIYAALFWFTLQSGIKNFHAGTFVLAQSIPIPTWPAYLLPPAGFALAALVTGMRCATKLLGVEE